VTDIIQNALKTPLNSLHKELGGRMVSFAGYEMPVQFPLGIKGEHLHTRAMAGLFDVSHMGQLVISGAGAAAALEALIPVDIVGLEINQQSYGVLTNEKGGIRDDLIICRWAEDVFFLVVNADCKRADIEYLRRCLPDLKLLELSDRALLALQGPAAAEIMQGFVPAAGELIFLKGTSATIDGVECYITRSGYTGEDGYEISIAGDAAERLARRLLSDSRVQPIGLGARDSLRLESGLCLYGHDMNTEISPIEAGLQWSISKARRAGGARPGGFPGADLIMAQMRDGAGRKRVGLKIEGKAPVREGAAIVSDIGTQVGLVTSGGFAPSFDGPVAMALVESDYAGLGQSLNAMVRDKPRPVTVVATPFVPQRYFRG
jgi:aminomethyltransferase